MNKIKSSNDEDTSKNILNLDFYMHIAIMNTMSAIRNTIENGKPLTEAVDIFNFEIRNLSTIAKAKGYLSEKTEKEIEQQIETYINKLDKNQNPISKKYDISLIKFETIMKKIHKSTPSELSVEMTKNIEKQEEEGFFNVEDIEEQEEE